MKRFELILGGAALTVLSISAAVYVANHPLRKSSDPNAIVVGAAEHAINVSPLDVLEKATPAVMAGANGDSQTSPTGPRERFRREPVVYPDWRPGSTRIETATVRRVTEPANYTAPVWSPVGLDIAFTREGADGLYVAGPGGQTARLLTDDPGTGSTFMWNHDGMSVYLREPDGTYAELMITGEKYPAADRKLHVFERDNMIYYRPEEGEPVAVSGATDRFFNPVLAPDESAVVFSGRETGLYLVNVDGSSLISVGPGENPSWLPDSSGIVFNVPVSDGTRTLDSDLWYASADGRERTNLTNTPQVVETHPAVSPDGQRIAYISGGAVYVARFVRLAN